MIKIPTDRKYPIKHKLAFASDKIFQITPKIRLILFTVLVFYLSSAHNRRRLKNSVLHKVFNFLSEDLKMVPISFRYNITSS